jgi:hypothetical protein
MPCSKALDDSINNRTFRVLGVIFFNYMASIITSIVMYAAWSCKLIAQIEGKFAQIEVEAMFQSI